MRFLLLDICVPKKTDLGVNIPHLGRHYSQYYYRETNMKVVTGLFLSLHSIFYLKSRIKEWVEDAIG